MADDTAILLSGARRTSLGFFDAYLDLYRQAAAVVPGAARYPRIDFERDVRVRYLAASAIALGALRSDAELLRKAVDGARSSRREMADSWTTLSGWHGKARDAAERYCTSFHDAGVFVEAASTVPLALHATADGIERDVTAYLHQLAGLNQLPAIYQTFNLTTSIALARGGLAPQAANELALFINDFDNRYYAFHCHTENLVHAITERYKTMKGALGALHDDRIQRLQDPAQFGNRTSHRPAPPGGRPRTAPPTVKSQQTTDPRPRPGSPTGTPPPTTQTVPQS
ncbi:MAG TPA: hypothetical protein VGX25_33385 [Actinophytocola sp.]|uniref:hypothetical protein n=1 Tax=Actinophytocola sp. TaxID=1872138 RepID=UPI002DDC9681|nr:hypothetical protein [Actinophytocola sp.]HEV2784306.1 hypothetical protein [Actinophytocola sp.]